MADPKVFTWIVGDRVYHLGRRPLLMGIVNVTPDSFSDGGQFFHPERAIEQGLRLVEEGADLLDVGGESTRPGSLPVPLEEELRRVVPVIRGLARQTRIPLSVDTSKAAVARAACDAGAGIINDVTALTGDPEMPSVTLAAKASLILMHMQGTPATMQDDPHYADVVREVGDYLQERLASLEKVGIEPERMAIDPGIGFGKKQSHNLALLAQLEEVRRDRRPMCLGVSRKGFLNRLLGQSGAVERGDHGTVGILLQAIAHGSVQIARVHRIQPIHDAMTTFLAVENWPAEAGA